MDDLTRIKGIGKAAAATLVAAGIDSFEKLAHDGLVGQHGIKVEWISDAAKLLHEGPAEKQGSINKPESAAGGDGDLAIPAQALPGRNGWLELEGLGQEEAERRFPLVLAAMKVWADGARSMQAALSGPTVRIAAKRDGFRRAGMAHPRQPTEYPAEQFTPEQLEALLADAALKVELV